MTAYLIVDTDIHDHDGYEEYKTLARPIAEGFGGEYVVRGGEMHVHDETLWSPTRLVVIRFPDVDAAEDFLASDAYAPVKAMRHECARSTTVVVEGL